MSGRDLGHFGCDGRYRFSASFNSREMHDFLEFVKDGVKDVAINVPPIKVEYLDDHTIESCAAMFPGPRTYRGTPLLPEPVVARAPSARDVLREQSELIAKYAAYCERKAEVCSNVATLVDYRERAKLARDIALIYFRSATLEV